MMIQEILGKDRQGKVRKKIQISLGRDNKETGNEQLELKNRNQG